MDVKTFFNNLAPVWDSREPCTTHQLRPFVELSGAKCGDKVLDLGCGTGIISGILRDMGCDVTAMDISDKMIELAKARYGNNSGIDFVCQDFFNYNGDKFDCVVIFNAYPHFTDKTAFVNKLHDVLNENGKFAVMHNIGRETLTKHHQGAEEISSQLLPVEQEKMFFTDKFNITLAEEDSKHYLIEGVRK